MNRTTVGVVGAGQLARMMLAAATALDIDLRLLAASADDGAARVWPHVEIGRPDDAGAVERFTGECDVVTFDHELVPPELLQRLDADHVLRPGPRALLAAQDKLHQRGAFTRLGVPVPAYAAADDTTGIEAFAAEHGWPIVLKAPRGGYDGRGVAVVESAEAVAGSWAAVGGGVPVLVEQHLDLDREIAVLLARRPSGQMCVWPVVDTVQEDGMLAELCAPAELAPALSTRAVSIARQIAQALDVVGVLAVELFVVGDDLLVNEVALRPHNSGHWTIEGAVTSQFEQHLRAVLDWPLGSVAPTAPAVATVNVVGPADGSDPASRLGAALAVEGAHVHLYGKGPRPGRKLGHVTVPSHDRDSALARAHAAASILEGRR